MPVITQTNNLGDLLKYEAPNLYSREAATIAAGQNLLLGTVLARQTADGKCYALAPAATDGTEVAVGVLATDTDATLIDREDALRIARHAILSRQAVIWPAGITAPQKAAATAELEALGILIRDSA
jgi:hypothetical protein